MANLIGFDKNRGNVQFKGHSKLSVNFMSDYLYIEPQNEEFKLISSSFKWNYVMKKSLLFVFTEFDFLDFCLEFRNEAICQKIFNYVASGKKDYIEQTLPGSIDDGFIKPIFQRIADNPTFNSALIDVMAKWYQLLDEDDKVAYTELMTEYGIHDLISAAIQAETTERSEPSTMKRNRNRKRKFCQIKKEEELDLEMEKKKMNMIPTNYSESSTFFQLVFVPKKQHRTLLIYTSDQMDSFHQFKTKAGSKNDKFKCITCEKKAFIDVNHDGEICVKLESKKHSCEPSKIFPETSTKIKLIQKSDYEIYDNNSFKYRKLLVVFDSHPKNFCYEYFWHDATSKFYCRGCCSKKITNSDISKANIRNEGSQKEYVECFTNHQCEKRKYSPEKYAPIYDYVLKPDFEIQDLYRKDGKEKRRLFIFDKNDTTKYYQYYYYTNHKKFICCRCIYAKKIVTATLHQNSENVEYILLSNVKHVCEMRSSDSTDRIFLHQHQDFEIIGETKKGNPKIFVFANNDRKNGSAFYNKGSLYACLGCMRRKNKKDNQRLSVVYGKLLKNEETGKYSFEIKPNQIHSCQPRSYEVEKYEDIPKTYDFFYYRLKNGKKPVKLAIHSPENDQFCFTFVYEKSNNYFICMECKKKKKIYTVKLQKDADGKEYFNHNVKKHICKPIKVTSISKSDIVKEHGIKFESKLKSKINESKIIKPPNFELRPNKAGVPERRLIILYPNDKNLCFELHYHSTMQLYYCNKCRTKKTTVSAKLHKNNDEENGGESFIVMGKNEHVCEPIKYQPL